MDIQTFNQKIETIIEALDSNELQLLHKSFLNRDGYGGSAEYTNIGTNPDNLRSAIKRGLEHISIEELRTIAPPTIKNVIDEFIEQERTAPEIHFPEPTASQDSQDDNREHSSIQPPTHLVNSPVLQNKQVQTVDVGVNIKPLECIISDTARRALTSGVMIPERLHLILKENRVQQPYAHVGVNTKGNPVALLREDEKKCAPLSLMDLTAYFLGDIYMQFKAADSTIKSLKIKREMVMQSNAALQQKANMYELELIAKTFNG